MDEEDFDSCPNCGDEMCFDQDLCDACEEEEYVDDEINSGYEAAVQFKKDNIHQSEYWWEGFMDEI